MAEYTTSFGRCSRVAPETLAAPETLVAPETLAAGSQWDGGERGQVRLAIGVA